MPKVWRRGEKAGKRLAWSHPPIPMVHQGEPAVLNEESESPQGNNLMEKKKDPQLLPEPVEQQRQASVSPPPVADAGLGLTVRKQADRRESCTVTASPSDSSIGGAAIGGPQTGISVFGVSTVGRTKRRFVISIRYPYLRNCSIVLVAPKCSVKSI